MYRVNLFGDNKHCFSNIFSDFIYTDTDCDLDVFVTQAFHEEQCSVDDLKTNKLIIFNLDVCHSLKFDLFPQVTKFLENTDIECLVTTSHFLTEDIDEKFQLNKCGRLYPREYLKKKKDKEYEEKMKNPLKGTWYGYFDKEQCLEFTPEGLEKEYPAGSLLCWDSATNKCVKCKDKKTVKESSNLNEVNRRVLETLVKCGSFDSLHENRAQLFAVIETAFHLAQEFQIADDPSQESLFQLMDSEDVKATETLLEFPEVRNWSKRERLKLEKMALG